MDTTKKLPSVRCDTCGETCTPSGMTTGYGTDSKGSRHCFACYGIRDRADMVETGRATLYLTRRTGAPRVSGLDSASDWELTNWPGSLSFRIYHTCTGRHNWTGHRRDIWFRGPDGRKWWGWRVEGGMNSGDLINVRRTKG